MELMIDTNAELEALAHLNHPVLSINLRSLGNLGSAPALYQTFLDIYRPRMWVCPKIKVFQGFCCMAVSLQTLRAVLQMLVVHPNVALNGPHSLVPTFVWIGQVAGELLRSKSTVKYRPGTLHTQATGLGGVLTGLVDHVLMNRNPVQEFKDAIVPELLPRIDSTLNAVMLFPHTYMPS
jgi:hypothetical protein